MNLSKLFAFILIAAFLYSCSDTDQGRNEPEPAPQPEEVQTEPAPAPEPAPEPEPDPMVMLDLNGSKVETSVGNWQDIGSLNASVEDNVIITEVTSTGGNSWEPKVFVQLPELVDGTEYVVSITASAARDRKIWLKIGQQLPFDPWWIKQYEDETGVHQLTSSDQLIETTFTFNKTDNGAPYDFVIEVGNVEGDAVPTTVYVKDVSIRAK
jgi:hypothetical protein